MKTIAGIIFALFVLLVVAIIGANAMAHADECPVGHLCGPVQVVPSVASPAPLSAIAVTQCGLAVSLFIQLDATHLLRADPRQSDMFTAVNGKMVQSQAGPMTIDQALAIAEKAVLSTNVVLPCTDGPTI